MNRTPLLRRARPRLQTLLLAVGAVFTTLPLPVAAQQLRQPVARVLTPLEAGAIDGFQGVPQADLNLRASAAVSVWAHNRGPLQRAVQRSNLGVDAAVYASVPWAAAPMLPADVAPHVHDFIVKGNTAQAWATMTAQGVPHLHVVGHGDFRADATAAWTGRFTLGGSTSKEVVLRFTVPPTEVSGDTEAEGPAWWRARMRTDVLVNGFPAWSTEALRLRADPLLPGQVGAPPTLALLQTFGDPLTFPSNDEDLPLPMGGPANDTSGANMSLPSASRTVHLSLGRFNPGQTIELQMIVRGTAFTEPTSHSIQAAPDHRCRERPDGGWFCSRGTVSVRMGNGAPQVTLLP